MASETLSKAGPVTKESYTLLQQKKTRQRLYQLLVYLLLLVLGALFALPLVWMLSTALKSNDQLIVFPPIWIPKPLMWENFPQAWQYAPFGTYLLNTLVVTMVALLGQVLSASFVAYGFARLRFPGREQLFVIVLATMMLPYIVTLVPIFLIFRNLGWIDTYLPLTVPHYFGGGPFFIFLLRQYFRTIPMELSDAARIDGAGEFGIFFRIIIPLSLPALATVCIFSFLGHWNDFLGPLIYINSEEKKTLMLGLQSFIGLHNQRFQYLMAMSTLITLPTLILFFLFQRVFIRSIVLTGMKG
ncbi:MAG: carbohydrate ABC transporter permease [Caldilineaceae bacterium]